LRFSLLPVCELFSGVKVRITFMIESVHFLSQ
jgi:hypothetical protein